MRGWLSKNRFGVGLALIVALLRLAPALSAELDADSPARVFAGFPVMPTDHAAYASFIGQTADDGAFCTENRFTTEAQDGRFCMPFYVALGWLHSATGLDIPTLWHVVTMLVALLFLVVVWWALKSFVRDERERKLAFALVCFGGGLEWLAWGADAVAGGSLGLTASHWVNPWSWSTFWSTLMPQWTIAQLCVVLIAARAVRTEPGGPMWREGVAACVAWFVHPWTGTFAFVLAGALALVPQLRRHRGSDRALTSVARATLVRLWPVFLAGLPVVAYSLWARGDPVFRQTSSHAFSWNDSYGLLLFPVFFGLLLPAAAFAVRDRRQRERGGRQVLLTWLLLAVVASQNPWMAAVKFNFLVHLPLAILAARGLTRLASFPRLRSLSRPLPAALVMIALCASPLAGLARTLPQKNLYVSLDALYATSTLRAQPRGNVLTAFDSGHHVTWLSGQPVYAGHWYMTLDLAKKDAAVRRFFSPDTSLVWKQGFLAEQDIAYVYYGPHERRLGELDPDLPLEPLLRGRRVLLFEVDQCRLDTAAIEQEQRRLDALGRAKQATRRGDRAAALQILEGLAAERPDDFEVWVELAGAYLATGDLTASRSALEGALRIRKDDDSVKLKIRQLERFQRAQERRKAPRR